VTKVSIEFVEKQERKRKDVYEYRTEHKPRSARNTGKARQNGENVNPFGAMASVAGDRSGPWTRWIDPAPV